MEIPTEGTTGTTGGTRVSKVLQPTGWMNSNWMVTGPLTSLISEVALDLSMPMGPLLPSTSEGMLNVWMAMYLVTFIGSETSSVDTFKCVISLSPINCTTMTPGSFECGCGLELMIVRAVPVEPAIT